MPNSDLLFAAEDLHPGVEIPPCNVPHVRNQVLDELYHGAMMRDLNGWVYYVGLEI